MLKSELYEILDIDSPDEFEYFENIAALMESDEYIDASLLHELFNEMDMEEFGKLMGEYFDELLRVIPDGLSDLYLTMDNIKREFDGMFSSMGSDPSDSDLSELANEIVRLRKWFDSDELVKDNDTDEMMCVRDALYNVHGSQFDGSTTNYDWDDACDYTISGYDVPVSALVNREQASSDK